MGQVEVGRGKELSRAYTIFHSAWRWTFIDEVVRKVMAQSNEPEGNYDPRNFCFEGNQHREEFTKSLTDLIGRLQKNSRQLYINEDNVLRMNHGRSWTRGANLSEAGDSMHQLSAEWRVPFADIANNDLSLILRSILPLVEDLDRQFATSIYSVVGAAAERVGNVVDAANAKSFADSMIEMLKRIEFGVDRHGNVSLPQIHAGPAAYEKMVSEFDKVSPEVSKEIESLKQERIAEALEREKERKAKFKQENQ